MSAKVQANSFVVECYWPGINELRIAGAASRVREAVRDLERQGRELRFVGGILVPVEETVFLLFEGKEADVRAASDQAGIPFERVLESLWIAAGFGPA